MLSQGSYTVLGNIQESQKNNKRNRQESGVGGVDKVGLFSKVSWEWKKRETQPLWVSRPRGGGGGADRSKWSKTLQKRRPWHEQLWNHKGDQQTLLNSSALGSRGHTELCFFTCKTVRCSPRPPLVLNLRQEQLQMSSFVPRLHIHSRGRSVPPDRNWGSQISPGPQSRSNLGGFGKAQLLPNGSSMLQWPCIPKAIWK